MTSADRAALNGATWWLVRHGQTEHNLNHRVQGWCDSPLTDVGVGQALAVRELLAGVPLRHAVVSTSPRAVHTASIILEDRCLPVTFDPDWREMHFGDFEAGPESALIQAAPGPAELFGGIVAGTSAGLPGAQTPADYLARLDRAYARTAGLCAEGDVLVVSHGVTIWSTVMRLVGVDLGPIPNGSAIPLHRGRSGFTLLGADEAPLRELEQAR